MRICTICTTVQIMLRRSRQHLRRWVLDQWQLRRWMWILWPCACLYAAIMRLRYWAYKRGLLTVWHARVPVWVVGNLTVGGTGKTALVLSLVKRLQAMGHRPGVVSRGYGGLPQKHPILVTVRHKPALVGDEACLLAAQGCPVVVCINRPLAAKHLLAHHDCNVLISDDGLQHLALGRDLALLIVDHRGYGNAWCLPAGPLREPMVRAQSADYLIHHDDAADAPFVMKRHFNRLLALLGEESMALKDCQKQAFQVLTAIGHPRRLLDDLQKLGVRVVHAVCLPDHHLFSLTDLARLHPEIPIICTAKDAVKLRPLRPHLACWVLEEVLVFSRPLSEAFVKICATL